MSIRFAGLLIFGLLTSGLARAETLPLPDNLTGFDSDPGEQLLSMPMRARPTFRSRATSSPRKTKPIAALPASSWSSIR